MVCQLVPKPNILTFNQESVDLISKLILFLAHILKLACLLLVKSSRKTLARKAGETELQSLHPLIS